MSRPFSPATAMRLYYNPRCSKSRAALALLEEAGHTPQVRDYLKNPPSAAELGALLAGLDSPPASLVRTGDTAFADSGYSAQTLDRERVLSLLLDQPALMQRPVIQLGTHALIARPPERVFELIDSRQDSDS
ncbi:arsenate reductase family protein [Salinisphaera sp. S4-8]|uniref:arsenate reductase family protein n=1 Tax=Salinisphaera sp. S4-8 TaxID=633357 RepID=UPI00333F8861